jgi:hypothetical protein
MRSKKIIQLSSTNGADHKRQGKKIDSLTGLTSAKRPARRKGQSKQLNEVGNEISTGSKQARGTGSKQEQRRTEPSPGWLQHKSDYARSCAAGVPLGRKTNAAHKEKKGQHNTTSKNQLFH